MSLWFLHVHLCCGLYRSPSWPVWAPRIPNSSQNSAQPIACRHDIFIEPPLSHPSSLSHVASRTRFWSTSSPLSSRSVPTYAKDSTGIVKNIYSAGNGLLNNNSSNNGYNDTETNIITPGIFRIPDVPQHSRKNDNFEMRNERNAIIGANTKESNGQQSNVFPVAKPRISALSWRGMSKTCDCIEKGKTSPVLKLVDQARAVSSPDPLHRPDNQRTSLRPATTAQTFR